MAHHRTLLHLDLVIGLCIDSEIIKHFPSFRTGVPLFSQSGPWPVPSSVKNEIGLVFWTPRWGTVILGSSSLWASVSDLGLFSKEIS